MPVHAVHDAHACVDEQGPGANLGGGASDHVSNDVSDDEQLAGWTSGNEDDATESLPSPRAPPQVCTKPRFSRFSIWISVDLSAVWPCFHHRHSSFTSQTRVPHLHALICVQIAPQITNLQTKTSVLYTVLYTPDRD